ncbi:EutN/CcmL family microcompartment protein [Myxococcota bacterium]|jgi:microcompartment protein CcmK/EutM|nr:EutN/CcmL family microcompartment protein [Myxococcota bacterium]MBU1411486.1 EutN/CcmL family microcompartment protein [Myxococcota bacterium]MBU1509001.1 EutN/CcmL family microcompartment protein [Myxococcota bacterium]PKN26856.1 MAG: ethanolamine utilization protein EutN [Deltaproteobacteria bacterium HGW-Deltaproteobacteria-22]
MLLARVVGNVVSTRKSERLTGTKLLIIEPVDFKAQKSDGKPLVAIDAVGAGVGEIVLIVQGSSARLTETTKDTPVDATIMAIVDYIELEGKRTFAK